MKKIPKRINDKIIDAEIEFEKEKHFNIYTNGMNSKVKRSKMFYETLDTLSDKNNSYETKRKTVDSIFKRSKDWKNKGLPVNDYHQGSIDAILYLKKQNNLKGENLYGFKLKK